MSSVTPIASPRLPLGRALPHWPELCLATSLFVLDAFVMGQGLVAGVILLAVGTWLLPKAWLFSLAGRSAWPTLRLAGALFAASLASMATINANNAVARERAEDLVAAVDAFRAVNGRYPGTLQELVPAYVASVPRAKYMLGFNYFIYFRHGDDASLAYIDVPPHSRSTYDFADRSWERER